MKGTAMANIEDMDWDDVCTRAELWYQVCEFHWPRLKGDFHNDKQFWDDLFHNMDINDWISQVRLAQAFQATYPKMVKRFPNYHDQLDEVTRRIREDKAVIKPFNKTGWNKAAVGLFMAVRDILNELKPKNNYEALFEEK
jgi:hypothetical protein